MARNQEKAQATLNRFLAYKKEQLYGNKGGCFWFPMRGNWGEGLDFVEGRELLALHPIPESPAGCDIPNKEKKNSHFSGKRPAFAHECNNLLEAERWRRQIIKEISKE
eukprot:402090-Amorphochlora_amoeboformis.AAC.1